MCGSHTAGGVGTLTPIHRPREHVLESESRRAFEGALPTHWLCRWQELDYGIDGTVEVVTEEGVVTGEVFAVQLKGTDAEGPPRVRLTTRHLQYYEMYPLPVMIAVYSAGEDQIYGRWIHEVLDEEGKDGLATQDTMTVPMREEDLLDPERADGIRIDLRTELATRRLRPSVTVVVARGTDPEEADEGNEGRAVSVPGRLQGEIQSWADQLVPGRIRVLSEGQEHAEVEDERLLRVEWRIEGGELEVAARPGGGAAILPVLDWTGPVEVLEYWVVGDHPTPPVSRILISAAILLSSAQDPDSASRLLMRGVPSSGDLLERAPALALLVAATFDAAMRSAEAMELAEGLVASGHAEAAAALAARSAMSPHRGHSAPQRYRSILRRGLEGVVNARAGARINYNLAESLRSERRFREAVGHYHRASKLDPSYRDRAYWWEDLAGCLFETRHYAWSAEAYRRGLEAAQRDRRELRILPKLADALAFSGRYAEALRRFREYEERADEPHPEWVLKRILLASCADRFGDQRRDPGRAEELSEEASQQLAEDDVEAAAELVEQALGADCLYARAWFVQEQLRGRLDDQEGTVFAQAMRAVFARNLEPWAGATVNCLATGELPTAVGIGLMGHLIQGGHATFGAAYIERVRTMTAEMGLPPRATEAVRVLIRLVLDSEYTAEDARGDLPVPGGELEEK